ncbi:Phospho-N-acetylmuramoyl-pentapeptide-transferase [bioreactor metagenome]|uniref:Phospho-N-acetylmuramoyl-pentapeptide-transferase n=1 Tax=bioreactor metagenome TaxID=1076179 RepID=A0A645GIG1_9ZZZZ
MIIAALYLLGLYLYGDVRTDLYIPFVGYIELSFFYYIFALVLIVGAVNATNLTDGIDGLCGSVTFVFALIMVVISGILGQLHVSVLAVATAGGCLGFLFWNFYPAKVFMGDTGSLFLAGVVCALSFGLNMPVILVIVGLVYVVEALSDIIQVFYYKATKKRSFKMAPLHHHFEKCGWSEEKIVYIFSGMTILLCIIAFMAVMQYYFM